MHLRDLKYLFAYIVPAICFFAFSARGYWTWALVFFVYIIIPVIEPMFKSSEENLDLNQKDSKLASKFFDALLYLNLPIVYATIAALIYTSYSFDLSSFEQIGLILSSGMVLTSCGINVGHEIGHRKEGYNQVVSRLLLLPSLYMHFNIEHNRGHHKNVATDEDPASARYGEIFYTFWFRSVIGSYLSAWNIQRKDLEKNKLGFFSSKNLMLQFHLVQIFYLVVIAYFSSISVMLYCVAAGVISFSLLEVVNYIEHYGLRRAKKANGRYERVMPRHSWNSNHHIGRILLYELTRHSDHHYLASKKYQVLDHHEEAKQLPFGYPTAILTATIPPLWFKIMNPRVQAA